MSRWNVPDQDIDWLIVSSNTKFVKYAFSQDSWKCIQIYIYILHWRICIWNTYFCKLDKVCIWLPMLLLLKPQEGCQKWSFIILHNRCLILFSTFCALGANVRQLITLQISLGNVAILNEDHVKCKCWYRRLDISSAVKNKC